MAASRGRGKENSLLHSRERLLAGYAALFTISLVYLHCRYSTNDVLPSGLESPLVAQQFIELGLIHECS